MIIAEKYLAWHSIVPMLIDFRATGQVIFSTGWFYPAGGASVVVGSGAAMAAMVLSISVLTMGCTTPIWVMDVVSSSRACGSMTFRGWYGVGLQVGEGDLVQLAFFEMLSVSLLFTVKKCLATNGTVEDIKHSFLLHIIGEILVFVNKYADCFNLDLQIQKKIEEEKDAVNVLMLFAREMKIKKVSIFMIIDEYDNFANNILIEHGEETYMKITHTGGFLRGFFTAIKGLTDNREIDRLFITGVSPLVMADVTAVSISVTIFRKTRNWVPWSE